MAEKNQQAAAAQQAVATKKSDVGEQIIARVNNLCANGFNMPADYNYVNAIKMSMLKLQDTKDKNGNSALQVCTPNSVATALFKMCTKGLNAALNQGYLLVYGDQLTFQESYFGKILQVKRIFPNWEPAPRVIREGDDFVFDIDNKTGRRKLVKHTQTLASMDADFVGGYLILPTADGEGDLYIMTKKQILAAWAKSKNTSLSTHKQFDEKMVQKTLVNSGCNTIINSTPELALADNEEVKPVDDADDQSQLNVTIDPTAPAEVINPETGEVVPPASQAHEEKPKATPVAPTNEQAQAPAPAAPQAPANEGGEDW